METEKNITKSLEEINNRRLDSLSKLLARGSGSTCVAVLISNGQFFVTSNDFFVETKTEEGNKKLKHIRDVLGYFQKITEKKEITEIERKNIFKSICSSDKSAISESSYFEKLSNDRFEKVIEDVLSGTPISPDIYRKKFGKAWKVAWDAYGGFNDLLRKFNKVENWLRGYNTEDIPKIVLSSEDPNKQTILMREFETGVHAEMQMLATLVEQMEDPKYKQKEKVYIGISRLCCLHCSRMLEAANEVFSKHKFGNVVYRGAHKLEFDKNWKTPVDFLTKEGRKDWGNVQWRVRGKISEELAEKFKKIKEEIEEVIKAEKKAKKTKQKKGEENKEYKYQSPSPSTSEGSPLPIGIEPYENSPIHILLNLREHLEEEIKLEKQEIDSVLQIMLNLVKIQSFSEMFKNIPLESQNAENDFILILEKMQNTAITISKEELLKIMQNNHLVGEKLANNFGAIGKELKEEKKEKKDETEMEIEKENPEEKLLQEREKAEKLKATHEGEMLSLANLDKKRKEQTENTKEGEKENLKQEQKKTKFTPRGMEDPENQ